MLHVPGFQVVEELHRGQQTQILRALPEGTTTPVILKLLHERFPSHHAVASLQREFALVHSLDIPGVIRFHALHQMGHTPMVEMEDIGGASLSQHTPHLPLSPLLFVRLARQLTTSLQALHQQRILHKNIHPDHIIWSRESNTLRLIDFGIASILPKHRRIDQPEHIEGHLETMAPEQSTRLNKALDHRTDLYALGVTFYFMLAGHFPFAADDELGLIHAHIATNARPLTALSQPVAKQLSRLVAKLMAKKPEERYQSCDGLDVDLKRCEEQLLRTGILQDFPLGAHDYHKELVWPQRLYGREDALGQLHEALARTQKGPAEWVLIAGIEGAGKSALFEEFRRSCAPESVALLSCKFDRHKRAVPYESLLRTFRNWLKQRLGDDEETLRAYKERLEQKVGGNLQLLVDALPELARIVGTQPALADLGATESLHRFHIAFRGFMQANLEGAQQLVLFLDDLQWIDTASLQLLESVCMLPDTKGLLLIGGHRTPTPTVVEDLYTTLANKKQSFVCCPIDNLREATLCDLLSDMLGRAQGEVQEFAALCHLKTRGNPFVMQQLLQWLVDEDLLIFDVNHRHWRWDLPGIRALQVQEQGEDLLLQQIVRLSPPAQRVLTWASCMGYTFDASVLFSAANISTADGKKALAEAVGAGLLVPLWEPGQTETRGPYEATPSHMTEQYKCTHDRVYQTLATLLAPGEREAAHRALATAWEAHWYPDQRYTQALFGMVYHLNQCSMDAETTTVKYKHAANNLLAGQAAREASAFADAFAYFQHGIQWLQGLDHWQHNYKLSVALYLGALEAAHLCGKFVEMKVLGEVALQHVDETLDRVQLQEVPISASMAQPNPLLSLEAGLTVLRQFGIQFQREPSTLQIVWGLLQTRWRLYRYRNRLDDHPAMTDPHQLTAMRVLSKVIPVTYNAAPKLFPLLIFKMIELSLRYGHAPQTPFAYAGFSLILCGVVGAIEEGYKLSNRALSLLDELGAHEQRARVYMVHNSFARHWKEHPRECIAPLAEAHRAGTLAGDLEFAAYSASVTCHIALWSGMSLPQVETHIQHNIDAIKRIGHQASLTPALLYHQVTSNLMSHSDDPSFLEGESYQESHMLAAQLNANNMTTTFEYYLHKMVMSYLFHLYPQGRQAASEAHKYIEGSMGTIGIAGFHYYEALLHLALSRKQANAREQKDSMRIAHKNLRKLQKWAQHAAHYLPKKLIVEAEMAHTSGDIERASYLFDQAIGQAHTHNFPQDQAVANERAALMFIAQKRVKRAWPYLQDALSCYASWGAQAKVEALKQHHSTLFATHVANWMHIPPVSPNAHTTDALDVKSVFKAARAISQELDPDKLLSTLLHITLENAGAHKGFLLRKQEKGWLAEVGGSLAGDLETTPTPLSQLTSQMPTSLITYVERTQETYVLGKNPSPPPFSRDPYWLKRQPASLLCMPLIHQGMLKGMLYLENNLLAGAFTSAHIELLEILCAQAAISIEHARQHITLEQEVAARTKELEKSLIDYQAQHEKLLQTKHTLARSEKVATLAAVVAGLAQTLIPPTLYTQSKAQTLSQQFALFAQSYKDTTPLLCEAQGERFQRQLASLQRHIEHLQDETKNIEDIVQQLTIFSQLDNTERSTVDLVELLQEAYSTACRSLSLSPPILWELPQRLFYECWSTQLYQAFEQVIRNALEALSEERRVPNQEQVRVALEVDRERSITIHFHDKGCGIAKEQQEFVFQPFFTTKTETSGSGLGLSIVSVVVQKHGGQIKFQSRPGEGTTLSLSLPRRVSLRA